ncbi:MAG TPA: DNA polymerase III subunit delta [Polyangiaceae bacterium]|nr:DNA polymerase III subunit delta [Polyangiaceae bacterium]
MTPDQAVQEARERKLRPVYLVLGDEAHLVRGVVEALRTATLEGAVPGLNEDHMDAAQRSVDDALSAARTLPMLARRRLVLVQRLEHWENRAAAENAEKAADKARGKGVSVEPFERLLEYAKSPSPSTTLILTGTGIDKRRKLYSAARTDGWLVQCDQLGRAELPGFVEREAKRRSARLGPQIADLLAELLGPELGPVVDAVERLALYAGGEVITEEMVQACVVRLRMATVWELLAAVTRRDLGAALKTLGDVFEPNEAVRLTGLLAWSARQLIRFEAALSAGASPQDAAQQAGAPPFRARELQQQIKSLPRPVLEGWLPILARLDGDLKGGSKLPPQAVLERAIFELCDRRTDARPG